MLLLIFDNRLLLLLNSFSSCLFRIKEVWALPIDSVLNTLCLFSGRLLLWLEALLSCRVLVRPQSRRLHLADPADLGLVVWGPKERHCPPRTLIHWSAMMISIFPLCHLLVLSVDKKGFFLFHFVEVHSLSFLHSCVFLSFVWLGGIWSTYAGKTFV